MGEGGLVYICVSKTRGKPKRRVESVHLRADHGIEGDAHAGPWHRQISLLDVAEVDSLCETAAEGRAGDCELEAGAFGENLGVRDVPLPQLGLGSRLRIGDEAEIAVTQIGKCCHSPCEIYERMGDCIMPRLGLFARATWGGQIRTGDPVAVVERVDPTVFQVAVLTISDRCADGEAKDTAGPAVVERLGDSGGFHIYRRLTLPDERDEIEKRLLHYSGGHSIDLVVTVGGTGFSPRDVTPEATRAVAERLAPGFDEAMRADSLRKTPHAMVSRGICGIRGRTFIVNLPGSRKAAVENLEAILPALPHALNKLRGDPIDCAEESKRG